MRLAVVVNGVSQFIASLPAQGYLNAHLNMQDRPKEELSTPVLRVAGIDTSQETQNEHLEWGPISLAVGDVVQVQVLAEGDGDPPSRRSKSSESPTNLLSRPELAAEVVTLIADFDKRLVDLVNKVKEKESAEESEKFLHAAGHVIHSHGALLYPIFRRHKELIPEELKGELL